MKSKPTPKTSLLLSQPHAPLLTQIPLTLSPTLTHLNLQNNQIKSLRGIECYTKLEKLNVSYNCIENLEALRELKYCGKLREIFLEGNPVALGVNFMFGVVGICGRGVRIDGVGVDCGVGVLANWQKQNGYKIAAFLLQSCLIFDSILKNTPNPTLNSTLHDLQSQLQNLSQLFAQTSQNSTKSDLIKTTNYIISDNLPLKCFQLPENMQQQLNDVKSYYIEKLLEVDDGNGGNGNGGNGGNGRNFFVEKIVQGIEVVDQEEEKELVNRIDVTKFIIRNQVQDDFFANQSIAQDLGANRDKQDAMKHFTSADTALQTFDTAVRTKKDAFKYGIHFCMDVQYLNTARSVLSNEISRLLHVITKQLQTSNQYQLFPTNPFQSYSEQSLNSPAKVYNNFSILSNILTTLQQTIKRVAFRRIRTHKNKLYVGRICGLFERSLMGSVVGVGREVFGEILGVWRTDREEFELMRRFRLKRLFVAWRNIHKRKIKILRNIIKRKIKCDKFLMSIVLTRWKMNSRADRIRKMASAAILSTRVSSIPKSKKGIELAYRRTIENRGRII